jgi:hypothetical protein
MRKAFRVDGRHEFVIDLVPQPDGTIKVLAPIAPPDPRGKGAGAHHRYPTGEVCVAAGRAPRTFDRAEAIARYWAERYSAYLATGTFADTGATVRV